MKDLGIGPRSYRRMVAMYDYPLFIATGVSSLLEEFPASLGLPPSGDALNLGCFSRFIF
jgi:hypothetical protein